MDEREQGLLAAHEARIAALVSGDLEALGQVVGEDLVFVNAAGKVMQVLQAGYAIGDRLLRPAMVGVSKGASGSVDTTA